MSEESSYISPYEAVPATGVSLTDEQIILFEDVLAACRLGDRDNIMRAMKEWAEEQPNVLGIEFQEKDKGRDAGMMFSIRIPPYKPEHTENQMVHVLVHWGNDHWNGKDCSLTTHRMPDIPYTLAWICDEIRSDQVFISRKKEYYYSTKLTTQRLEEFNKEFPGFFENIIKAGKIPTYTSYAKIGDLLNQYTAHLVMSEQYEHNWLR